MICVSIGRTRHKMMMVELHEAAKRGAEMIELRLDFLSRAPDFKRLLAKKPCPLVATVRRPEDGGRWKKDEEQRQKLLRHCIVGGFDWVDIETDIADKIKRFQNVKRIISYHNLHEMPDDLEDIHAKMCHQDPDVVKIAVRAQHPSDNLRVLNLIEKSKVPTAAHCMGDLGVPSRILSAKFGAAFTYAAFNKERGIAPGILSFEEMRKMYRYDELNSETKVYAVIGDPVGHSLSPLIHNVCFRGLGMNAVYVPMRVPRTELETTIKDFCALPVEGYSVTIPLKEGVVELATERDRDTMLTKAANTLLSMGEDGFSAFNMDTTAAVESIQEALKRIEEGMEVRDKTVLILGAGGAARAIAYGLHREGALVTVTNRTADRSKRLAEEIGCRQVEWGGRHGVMCDILVNCTPVGMHPNLDASPIHANALKSGMLVFDTVYNPESTLLLKEADKKGCHILSGIDMFARQAASQFRIFSGKKAPLDVIRKLVKQKLSPVSVKEGDG